MMIPRILIIDFLDSYTHNLLSLLTRPPISASNDDIASRVLVVKFNQYKWDDFKSRILPQVDCIILSPGPGTPQDCKDFGFANHLIASSQNIPILGVCLGHQGIATAFGGKVIHASKIMHGLRSSISHSNDPLFQNIPSEFTVVRYNSLVIDSSILPDCLEPIAWAEDDGVPTIMSVKHRQKPIYGVQFHPESVSSSNGSQLLANFLRIAARYMTPRAEVFPDAILRSSAIFHKPLDCTAKPGAQLRVKSHTFNPSSKDSETVFRNLIRNQGIAEVWLENSRPVPHKSQYSHLAILACLYSYDLQTQTITNHEQMRTTAISAPQGFFAFLQNLQQTNALPSGDQECPLGLYGYLSYELHQETMACNIPVHPNGGVPEGQMGLADRVLSYNHHTKLWTAHGLLKGSDSEIGLDEREWNDWVRKVDLYLSGDSRGLAASPLGDLSSLNLKPYVAETDYKEAIEAARAAIRNGHSYEITMTTGFSSNTSQDPYALFLALLARNPAPYTAFLDFRPTSTAILSSSPERFMKVSSTRSVEMRPIKGTCRRSSDPNKDAELKAKLIASPKEQAESLMIVDLIRAELMSFCKPDSVQVDALAHCEEYQTVFQLVSTIVGDMEEGVSTIEAIRRCFPPGSMTGAPKLRSMQILDKLEQQQARGVYSGVLGYIGFDGSADLSVVIRTLVKHNENITLGAGGAITWLSNSNDEWKEVLLKKNSTAG